MISAHISGVSSSAFPLEAVEDEGPVDETGIDAKDIDLVIQQVGCSRSKAVRALKDSGGDLINASEFHRVSDT